MNRRCKARHRALIESHAHLVPYLARKLGNSADLEGVGYLALTKAALKFNQDHVSSASFRTYAATVVRNAMIDKLRHDHWWSRKHQPIDEDALANGNGHCSPQDMLDQLSQRSRDLISAYFGLEGTPASLGELSQRYGKPDARIQRWIDAALARMRASSQTSACPDE